MNTLHKGFNKAFNSGNITKELWNIFSDNQKGYYFNLDYEEKNFYDLANKIRSSLCNLDGNLCYEFNNDRFIKSLNEYLQNFNIESIHLNIIRINKKGLFYVISEPITKNIIYNGRIRNYKAEDAFYLFLKEVGYVQHYEYMKQIKLKESLDRELSNKEVVTQPKRLKI